MTYQPPRPQQQQPSPGPSYSSAPAGDGHAAPEPPRKRRKWPWIVGGLVLVSILGCVGALTLFVGGAAKVASTMDTNQRGKNAVVGQMGRPARDGKLEFTVTGAKCGVREVGSEFLNAKPQGEFCLVSVTVKNAAATAETFVDSSQQALDAKGATYGVDSGAGLYANGETSVWLEQINPGATVRGKLVFDVPEGTKLTAVVLHESRYTAGIKVPLK
jgi:hypothetical protein